MLRPIVLSSLCIAILAAPPTAAQTSSELRDAASFAGIQDQAARSRALFNEAAKVITSPRCMNCHPADDHPTQGNAMREHTPPVTRGAGGNGVAGNTCQACHTDANYSLLAPSSFLSIPGHPRWMMATIEMAWQGKSIGDICRQLKDPKRNGGRSLELLHEHAAKDDLVAWGWHPGEGRDPAPGSQKVFGELIQAWIDSGAECP